VGRCGKGDEAVAQTLAGELADEVEFFSCTKKIHNGLQGEQVELSDDEKAI